MKKTAWNMIKSSRLGGVSFNKSREAMDFAKRRQSGGSQHIEINLEVSIEKRRDEVKDIESVGDEDKERLSHDGDAKDRAWAAYVSKDERSEARTDDVPEGGREESPFAFAI